MAVKRHLICIAIIIAFSVFVYHKITTINEPITYSGVAYEYLSSDSLYTKTHNVSIAGSIKSRRSVPVSFIGRLGISGIMESDLVSITFNERNCLTFGKVVSKKDGYLQTVPIYGVLYDKEDRYGIVVLFNEFEKNNNTIVSSMDFSNIRFLCVGNIERDFAANKLKQYFEK